jgi:hypothetical protein
VSILALWLKRGFIGTRASPGGSVAEEVVARTGVVIVARDGSTIVGRDL